MSENSKIEWTDHTLALGVHRLMTWFAKRDAVVRVQAQFGMGGKD
ncbi:MAG: hypothetical protein QOH33_2205 [Paraburkholderia sp.]|nr:hypothetical protein [Paraburkholderia sp.]